MANTENTSEVSFTETMNTSQRLSYGLQEPMIFKKEIPERILRQLLDRNYDRRKQAGNELQKLMKSLFEEKSYLSISATLEFFKDEYLKSLNENYRKGGLMAFSALAACCTENESDPSIINSLLEPVISCTRDYDGKVRFYAIETLYNIVKVCRQDVLSRFSDIFRCIIDLFADVENEVKRAAERLDNLLKTVLVECEADEKYFNSGPFMDIMNETLSGGGNPYVQQLLVSWLMVLDSIPNFNILVYIPMFIEGLLKMLKIQRSEIQQQVYKFLKDLLVEVKEAEDSVDFIALMDSMVKMSWHDSLSVRLESIVWIYELVDSAGPSLFAKYPEAIKASLQCLSDEKHSVAEVAQKANSRILENLSTVQEGVNFEEIMQVLITNLEHPSLHTKIAVLDWIVKIQTLQPWALEPSLQSLLSNLTRRLNENESSVIIQVLYILSNIANYKEFFDVVMNAVIELFLETRESHSINRRLIITTFCLNLGMEKVYTSFAESLLQQTDVDFCKTLIEILCNLLLSSEDFAQQRERLKYCIETEDKEYIEFFESLFKAWSFNPGATLTLTYLVQAYELAYEMLKILSRCRIDPQLLKQLAWLIQLLDSPIFVHLRLQMIENNRHPFLLRSLYAILVFLPTSQVHQSLQLRLKGVSTLNKANPDMQPADSAYKACGIDHKSLVKFFSEKNLPSGRASSVRKESD